jgi:flagellar protein FliO/FliZ
MSGRSIRALFVCALATPASSWAASAQEPAPVLSFGSVLQMFAGLVFVLALVAAGAWMLRRVAHSPRQAAGAIRIVASAAVGQRERVVLVEIAGTWLALGVAPGRVNALHTMPKSELHIAAEPVGVGMRAPFSEWLRLMRREEKTHGGTS